MGSMPEKNGSRIRLCRLAVSCVIKEDKAFAALSSRRLCLLWKSTNRTNDKTNLVVCRFVVISKSRRNIQTTKWNSNSPFWRLVQYDKTNMHLYVVPSFVRFCALSNSTKRTNVMAVSSFHTDADTVYQVNSIRFQNVVSSFSEILFLYLSMKPNHR